MIILNYPTKKALKENIGQPLKYTETSMFEPEYKETGTLYGCNRPHMPGYKRKFYATITMKDGLIESVK
ncbi:MAG: hypothetical protein PVI03_03990 [Candidatus Thorarchaeota archaeon]|jgi:hypothetical protein